MPTSSFHLDIERERASFLSNTELARAVLQRWARADPKANKPQLRSLAAKLSTFATDPVWWRNRLKASAALADALGLRLEDLQLGPGSTAKPRGFAFADFPELPPLDLTAEKPCLLTKEDPWWAADWLTNRGRERTWVNAPSGAGKTLAAEVHRARGTTVLTVDTLHDAIVNLPADPDHPIVIDVGGPNPATDGDAMEALRHRNKALVFASFPPPLGAATLARMLDYMEKELPEKPNKEDYIRRIWPIVWSEQTWEPMPDWRERFTRWIFHRRGGTDLRRVDTLMSWFTLHDPGELLFATPGDVLPLIECAFREGSIARLRPARLITTWLIRRFKNHSAPESPRQHWLIAQGENALRALADGLFDDVSVRFPARVPRSTWAAKVPPTLAPGDPVGALADEVDEIAQTESAVTRRKRSREFRQRTAATSANEVLGHLIAARVLQMTGDESVHLTPPWIESFWGQQHVEKLLDGAPSAWGRLAAEPSRRHVVETVLDGLDAGRIAELVRQVLAEASASPGLGVVGAVEALFGTMGRRFMRGETPSAPPKDLHRLARLQLQSVVHRGSVPQPLTRRAGSAPGDAAWVAECWAWSYAVARPEGFGEPARAWLLPGWSIVSLASIPSWLLEVGGAGTPGFQGLAKLGGKLLAQVRDPALPERLPAALLVTLILAAPTRSWKLHPMHVDHLLGHKELTAQLLTELDAADAARRSLLTTELFQALAARIPGWVPRLRREAPQLLATMANSVDLARVTAAAEAGGLTFGMLKERAAWPINWWNAAARVLIPKHKDAAEQLGDLHLDAESSEIVKLLHNQQPWNPRWTELYWRFNPYWAQLLAGASYPGEHAKVWFATAPDAALPELLDRIETAKDDIPAWARTWLEQRILDAGPLADRIHHLTIR